MKENKPSNTSYESLSDEQQQAQHRLNKRKEWAVHHTIHTVASLWFPHLPPKEAQRHMLSSRREADASEARWVVMYLLKEDEGMKLTEISRRLGKDHATVSHGISRITKQVEENLPLGEEIDMVRAKIEQAYEAQKKRRK